MSLIPTFELGLWNAWIFMLPYFLAAPFVEQLIKKRDPAAYSAICETKGIPLRNRILISISNMLFLPVFLVSFFLPLQTGTAWFLAGLPIMLIGLAGLAMVFFGWISTPPDKPITAGIYKFSRHPMYLTNFIFLAGLGIASASWILLIFSIIGLVGIIPVIELEERLTLDRYGDAYRRYMEKTPRWVGIPKTEKCKT